MVAPAYLQSVRAKIADLKAMERVLRETLARPLDRWQKVSLSADQGALRGALPWDRRWDYLTGRLRGLVEIQRKPAGQIRSTSKVGEVDFGNCGPPQPPARRRRAETFSQEDLRLLEEYGLIRLTKGRAVGKRRVKETLFGEVTLKIASSVPYQK
jgi:hypothetical protein